MKLYEVTDELKMPGVMKALIIDLSKILPWPFVKMNSSSKNPGIWFRAGDHVDHDKRFSTSGAEYVNVNYYLWGPEKHPIISVNTKGPHNDEVIKIVKKHRKDSNVVISGSASYPSYNQGF